MRERLETAIKHLKELRNNRQEEENAPNASEDIARFVEFVLWDSQRILNNTGPVLA